MRRLLVSAFLWLAALLLFSAPIGARPDLPGRLALDPEIAAGARKPPNHLAEDTTWIADWTFDDLDGTCDTSGWTSVDHFVRNDGSNSWSVGPDYHGQGFVTGNAAILRRHDLCWPHDGYGNSWDLAVVLRYRGPGARLSFDFASDSEPGFDFVQVEADSQGASGARAAATSPPGWPASFRRVLLAIDGPQPSGRVTALELPDFDQPDSIHSVYLRFVSDGSGSDQDGEYTSSIAAGLVVDNIVVDGSLGYSEDFEGSLDANVTLVNSAPSAPYETFARLVHHPLDLDATAEDSTCAWVFYDSTLACNSGSGGVHCVRPLADNSIVSPWVTLAGTGPVLLSFREWPSNAGSGACSVRTWAIRAQTRIPDSDTTAPDDSIDCETEWTGGFAFPTSNSWTTRVYDLSTRIPAGARAIQVRFRVMPFAYLIGHDPNPDCAPSPGGPYIDRVRIGRVGSPTAVLPRDLDAGVQRTALHQNVPNPFNPATTLRFDLARAGTVDLCVYDAAGRRVRTLVREHLDAGLGHAIAWDGRDDAGQRVPSGVYFCRLVTADTRTSRTLVLLE